MKSMPSSLATQVGRAVRGWRDAAARLGIAPNEMERMSSAFEHDDLKAAAAINPNHERR